MTREELAEWNVGTNLDQLMNLVFAGSFMKVQGHLQENRFPCTVQRHLPGSLYRETLSIS